MPEKQVITAGKKYTLRNGWKYQLYAILSELDNAGRWRVHGAYYNESHGVWYTIQHDINGVCAIGNESEFDLVEYSPYAHIKIDDKVLVSRGNIKNERRHFAGVNHAGKPLAWAGGMTSFTTLSGVNEWETCELYEEN